MSEDPVTPRETHEAGRRLERELEQGDALAMAMVDSRRRIHLTPEEAKSLEYILCYRAHNNVRVGQKVLSMLWNAMSKDGADEGITIIIDPAGFAP